MTISIAFRSVLLVGTVLGSSAFADETSMTPDASASIINAKGDEIGTADLFQGSGGVLIHVKVSGLTPGKRGLHLHSHGVCDTDAGFKTADGHVGKMEGGHGLSNANGPEAGDIPNIFIGTDGIGEMEAFSTFISLAGGDENLLDANGSTLIIHESADDHVTQPIGGAGARIACGIIEAN